MPEGFRFFATLPGQSAGEFKHGSGAGGVVVRAIVDLTFFVFAGKAAGFSMAQMIVMCSDDNHLSVGCATGGGKPADDVAVGALDVLHGGRDVDAGIGQCEAADSMRILVVQARL